MSTTIYTSNGKVLINASNNKWYKKPLDPFNPLGLDPLTIRAKFASGYSPTADASAGAPVTLTVVDADENIWDITSDYFGPNVTQPRSGWKSNMISVLGLNAGDGNIAVNQLFYEYTGLVSCANIGFKVSSVLARLFYGCTSLKNVPMITCPGVATTDDAPQRIDRMFWGCRNVESGTYNMYQYLRSILPNTTSTTGPYGYAPFYQCGDQTVTGAAELAQIPTTWGGTAE